LSLDFVPQQIKQ